MRRAEPLHARDHLVQVIDRRLDVFAHLLDLAEQRRDLRALRLGKVDERLAQQRHRIRDLLEQLGIDDERHQRLLEIVDHVSGDAAERREPLGLEQSAVHRRRITAERVRLGGPPQNLHELGTDPRLDDVARDQSLVDRTQDRTDVRVGGHDHAEGLWTAFLRDPQQLLAVHRRHAHVGDDNRDLVLLEDLDRGLRIRRDLQREFARERLLEDDAVPPLVVDIKHQRSRRHRYTRSAALS